MPREISRWDEFCLRLARRISSEAARSGRLELNGFVDDGLTIARDIIREPYDHLWGTLSTLTPAHPPRDLTLRLPSHFEFVLRLGNRARTTASVEELDLDTLLPERGATGWLTIDLTEARIVVDPNAQSEPTEDIVLRRGGRFTVVPRTPFADDEPGRTYRAVVHGPGFRVDEPPSPAELRIAALRRARRTGKRRPASPG